MENESTCATDAPSPCFNIPSAPDVLKPGMTWKFYGTGLNFFNTSIVWSMFDAIKPVHDGSEWGNVVTYDKFEQDIQAGTLPNVVWLVDQDLNSGHPPFSMCSSRHLGHALHQRHHQLGVLGPRRGDHHLG